MGFWSDWFGSGPASASVGPLAPRHAEALSALHAAAFVRPWSALDFETFLSERSTVADGLFLGRSDRPAGFALSRLVLDEAEILSVAVAPRARGRGLGGLLLRHHVGALVLAGIRAVHLEVEEGNRAAIALYESHGFGQVGRREGYYPRPDGRPAAALTMRRTI